MSKEESIKKSLFEHHRWLFSTLTSYRGDHGQSVREMCEHFHDMSVRTRHVDVRLEVDFAVFSRQIAVGSY